MTLACNLPYHVYGHVSRWYVSAGERDGWEPAVWFGVTLPRSRMIGLNVLLECGALYREVPSHAWSFALQPTSQPWRAAEAQAWDCFGGAAQVIEYAYLRELHVELLTGGAHGTYLFTLEMGDDGFSREPTQTKCFHAIHLDTGALTWQPNDRLRWQEKSFTLDDADLTWIRRHNQVWHAE